MKKNIFSKSLQKSCFRKFFVGIEFLLVTATVCGQSVNDARYWAFGNYTPGDTIANSLFNYDGLILRASTSRVVTSATQEDEGYFSDGSKWSTNYVLSSIATSQNFSPEGMKATEPVVKKQTDCCIALTADMPGTLYVIMKAKSTNADRKLRMFFNGDEVCSIPATDKNAHELKYTATEAGTFFFTASVSYYVHAVKFVPNEITVKAPSSCFTFSSPAGLDLSGSDLKAYYAPSNTDSTVNLKRIKTVPAFTGVIMRGEAGKEYTLPSVADSLSEIGNNVLFSTPEVCVIKPVGAEYNSVSYIHNQDEFAAELVRRWQDFWQERPGSAGRVCSGAVKIVFSDTQTHTRGIENYRTSGVVDPMRIPKDGYFAHQAIWDGWVDDLKPHTYIVGHWNYNAGEIIPVIYVVSTSGKVELVTAKGNLTPESKEGDFLYKFTNVEYVPGKIVAIGSTESGQKESSDTIETAGSPYRIRLTTKGHPTGWKADGADLLMVQVEIVDADGRRCPLDNRMINFRISGEAEWRGGVAHGADNYVLAESLPVECGVNRVLLRSTDKAGNVTLTASADGLPDASLEMCTIETDEKDGLSKTMPSDGLKPVLDRGETPLSPSFTQWMRSVKIASVKSGSTESGTPENSYDGLDNTTWVSKGNTDNAWITYTLAEETDIDAICMKMKSFRNLSYPLIVYAGDKQVWSGWTQRAPGYIRIPLKDVPPAKEYKIKMAGASTSGDIFPDVIELNGSTGTSTSNKYALGIVEIEFLKYTGAAQNGIKTIK